jgi:hypothetical protein
LPTSLLLAYSTAEDTATATLTICANNQHSACRLCMSGQDAETSEPWASPPIATAANPLPHARTAAVKSDDKRNGMQVVRIADQNKKVRSITHPFQDDYMQTSGVAAASHRSEMKFNSVVAASSAACRQVSLAWFKHMPTVLR